MSSDDALAFAAQSADPAIRSLVARRMELVVEVAKLDAFFAARTLGESPAVAQDSAASVIDSRFVDRVMPKAEFVAVVSFILVTEGAPLKPKAISKKFSILYPQYKLNAERIRQRLHGTKDAFRNVDRRGFWPVDLPVPPLLTVE